MSGFTTARTAGKVICCLAAAIALPFLSSWPSVSHGTESSHKTIEEEQNTYIVQVSTDPTPIPTTETEHNNASEKTQEQTILNSLAEDSTPVPENITDTEPETVPVENIFSAPSVTDYTNSTTGESIR